MRSLAIGAFCMAGCVLCGVGTYAITATWFSIRDLLEVIVVSAVSSVLAMPFLMYGVMKKPAVIGTALAFTPPAAWIAFTRISWGVDTPMYYLAFLFFAFACIALRVILPDVWPRHLPWVCQKCNYDLRGVPTQQCPECGRPFTGTHALPDAQTPLNKAPASDSAPSAPPR